MSEEKPLTPQPSTATSPHESVPQESVPPAAGAYRMTRGELIGWILLIGSLILGFGLTIFAPN